MGWIGSRSQLLHTLGMFGCDRDAEGNFCVDGGIWSFMGDTRESADVVVDDEAVYYAQGHPVNLAWALSQTSYGTRVKVL